MRPGTARRGFRGTRHPLVAALIAILLILSTLLFIYNFYWSSGSHKAKQAVRTFYELEQSGDYGSSWEMLHQQMKEKFDKDRYIQMRAMIYMQQLGATTFEFAIGDMDRLEAWSMSPNSPALTHVYRIPVEQKMMTVFGEWNIRQDVYAAEETDGWHLLWSYKPE